MGNILMKNINFIFTHQFNNYFLPNGLNDKLVENYNEQANLHQMQMDAYIKSGYGDPTGIRALSKKYNKKFYLHYTRDLYVNVLDNLNKINDFKYEFEYNTNAYQINLKNIDDVNEEEDNYYIINLFGAEDFLFSNVQPYIENETEIFDLIDYFNFDEKVISLLAKNKLKLVIMTLHEGGVKYEGFLNRIYKNIEKYSINPKNIFYINADAYITQTVDAYCKTNNITNSINVYNTTYLIHHSAKAFMDNDTDLYEKQNYLISNNDYKDKNFVCLNRTADKSHKLWLLSELYKNDILKDTLYSIIDNKKDEFTWNHNRWVKPEIFRDQLPYLNKIKEMGSITVKKEMDSEKFNSDNFQNPFNNQNSFLYGDSYISLVNESSFNAAQISEKITKSLFYFHPFIVISGPGYLKRLREMGFETFSQWWDESYDDEIDDYKRMQKISNLIKELNDKEKLHKIFLESKQVVLNNSLRFRKLKPAEHIKELFNWIFTC
jgi:hypothetical protein